MNKSVPPSDKWPGGEDESNYHQYAVDITRKGKIKMERSRE